MITIIANLKGGSGKSTIAFNLAVWLALHGRQVVGYDLDPQCTLTDVAQIRMEDGYEPVVNIHSVRAVLKEQLAAHTGEVLVDVGAANMAAMKEALAAADRVLIPVPPSQADVWATQRFLHIIRQDIQAKPAGAELLAFVNRADTNKSIRETHETEAALRMLPGIRVLPHRLRLRTGFRRSISEGLTVFEMWPNSKAAKEFHTLASALYPEVRGMKAVM
jgi:chromosome partitioning protein